MATSDSIQIAKRLDPEGRRTLGVITKIDIMDKGSDARDMLLNHEIPLTLGFVGVKGRSQQDINNKMPVSDALKIEQKFFSEHPIYSTLPETVCGTKALIEKLTKVLFVLIKDNLPVLKREIVRKREDNEAKLKALGPSLPRNYNDKFEYMWKLTQDLVELFKNEIDGKYDPNRKALRSKDGGASIGWKIRSKFDDFFKEFVAKDYRACKDLTDADISMALNRFQTVVIPGFPSIDAFLYLINPKLERLRMPSLALIDKVFSKMEKLVSKLTRKIFEKFPEVEHEVHEIIMNDLILKKEKCRETVLSVLECEENYIFTNDPAYLNHMTAEEKLAKTKGTAIPTTLDGALVSILRDRIDMYFYVVCKNMKDTIPKLIGNFLITESKNDLHFVLFNSVCSNNDIVDKFSEPKSTVDERERLEKMIDVLKQAEKKLISDPNLTSSKYDNVDIYDEMDKKNKQFLELTTDQLEHRQSLFTSKVDNSLNATTNERVNRKANPSTTSHGNDQSNLSNTNNQNYTGNNFSHFGGFNNQAQPNLTAQPSHGQVNPSNRNFTNFDNFAPNQQAPQPQVKQQDNRQHQNQYVPNQRKAPDNSGGRKNNLAV